MFVNELIFVSLEDWDEIWRRNQFFCDGLCKRHPELKILFVAPPKDVTNAFRNRRWRELVSPRRKKITADGRIISTRSLKLFPNTLSWGRKINEWLLRRHVRSAARALEFRSPALWLNPHWALHLVRQLRESVVVYDITDDWTTLTQSPRETALIQEQDRALCGMADAVIVCSERLLEMKTPLARRVRLIPNGVDADHYARVDDRTRALLEPLAGLSSPVLGYTGSIHPDRVDLGLVESLAKRLPQATILLVGPIMISAADRQCLEALGNVLFTGSRPYVEIPEYMRAFDVCITPHRVTAFTESLNPIKLWEYLAAGKPIISTRVAGFRDYPPLVYLADNAEKFAQRLEQALHEDPALREQRRAVARKHSWTARLEAVEEILGEAAATRCQDA